MAWALAVGALASPVLLCQPQRAPVGEYEVKAAFLYSFSKFIQWPSEQAPEEPFVITVLGDDPFGGVLDETLRGKVAGGKKVVIRRVARAEDVDHSQIVFISDSERERLPAILRQLEGAAILTVGEADHFAERGGVIRFKMENSRVRLEINAAMAERAHLKVSSELLKLARIVPRGGAD